MTVKTLTGMTTDVYPRENCIAPAIILIVWTTNTKNSGLGAVTGSIAYSSVLCGIVVWALTH